MHNMIELAHAVTCVALQKWVNRHKHSPADTLDTYIQQLYNCFWNKCSPEWGMKTLRRLFAKTLPAIIRNGGRWPHKSAR